MAQPGFFVFNSEVVTRIGVKATDFQRQVEGAQVETGASTAFTFQIADQSFATSMGLFQKLIGVGWGGNPRFAIAYSDNGGVIGGTDGVLLHLDLKDRSESGLPKQAFTVDGTRPLFINCLAGGIVGVDPTGSGGTPSFVITGDHVEGTSSAGSFILHSDDGITYSQTFFFPNDGGPYGSEFADGCGLGAVTFDGTTFWASGFKFANGFPSDVPDVTSFATIDYLLSSSDGISWSQAGSATYVESFPTPSEVLIVPHLDTRIKNSAGQGAVSGFFGERKNSDGSSILIHPTGNNFTIEPGTYINDNTGTSVTIVGGKASSGDVGFAVAVVAYGGKGTGAWLAVGPAASGGSNAAISVDDGATWTTIEAPDVSALQGDIHSAIGAFGAPLSKFS